MLVALTLITILIIHFISKNKLGDKYGLTSWPTKTKKFLYFIPLIVLSTGNLWGGIKLSYNGLPLLYELISMALIGILV